jgi:hypothetical protein
MVANTIWVRCIKNINSSGLLLEDGTAWILDWEIFFADDRRKCLNNTVAISDVTRATTCFLPAHRSRGLA